MTQSSKNFFARLCCLFCSGSFCASAGVACASVASASIFNANCLFNSNAIAITARTLLSLLTTRCERYSYNSCEQKC